MTTQFDANLDPLKVKRPKIIRVTVRMPKEVEKAIYAVAKMKKASFNRTSVSLLVRALSKIKIKVSKKAA